MSRILPTVRYLIVCESVHTDPQRPRRITLEGLLSAIHSVDDPPFPLLYREFSVFVQLAECRGPASGRVEIRNADTDEVVFRTRTRVIPLPNDPLEVMGVSYRIRDCLFPTPGLYYAQFWYNDVMLAQHSLLLREAR